MERNPTRHTHIESLTTLNWASHCGKVDIVCHLLSTSVQTDDPRYSSLDPAAKQGHNDVIQVQIDYGAEIDGTNF
jgi:ankyrin repeat protein